MLPAQMYARASSESPRASSERDEPPVPIKKVALLNGHLALQACISLTYPGIGL